MRIDGTTRVIAIVGDPTAHIKGFAEYAEAIAARGANAVYLAMHVASAGLTPFLHGVRHVRNLAGLVLTIPHKIACLAAATPDEPARLAGSANMLRPTADGWEASNCDGAGFLAAARAAGMTITARRVQLLGAGGAGRAVAMAIAGERPAAIAVHDTDSTRAEALAAALRRAAPTLDVTVSLGISEVLVNCTPIGMGHDTRLPCDPSFIPVAGAVYDIVNRPDTPLVVAARERGSLGEHGWSMMAAEIPLILDWLLGPRP
jgi:shikimate dehydrogenase